MKRRSNRFLMWALAISLAAHGVFIYWAQNIGVGYTDPVEQNHRLVLETPAPKPTPPPLVLVTPKPEVPHPVVATHPQHPTPPFVRPHMVARGGENTRGPVTPIDPVGPPGVGPTGPVEPTAAPAPSCTAPDVAAHVVDTMTIETPALAQEAGVTGTTEVEVSIDADGSVTGTSVYRSSGSEVLDNAALSAARRSTYRADMRNCEAVAGSYLFTVVFQ